MPPAMTNPSPAQLGLALVILKNVPLGLSAQGKWWFLIRQRGS